MLQATPHVNQQEYFSIFVSLENQSISPVAPKDPIVLD